MNSTNQTATAPQRAQLNWETSPAIEGNATTQNIDSGATQTADRVSEPSRRPAATGAGARGLTLLSVIVFPVGCRPGWQSHAAD